MNEVEVVLSSGITYPVIVGNGALKKLPDLISDGSNRAAIVTQSKIGIAVEPGIEN